MKKTFLVITFSIFGVLVWAGETNSTTEPKEKGVEYLRTINERAAKIAASLQLADSAKSNRVQQIMVEQYRGLNDIQYVRDIEIGNAKAKFAEDKTSANAAIALGNNATTGVLVDAVGWLNFFFLCTLLALPGMLLLPKVAPWHAPAAPPK